jgi:hypothetical protein
MWNLYSKHNDDGCVDLELRPFFLCFGRAQVLEQKHGFARSSSSLCQDWPRSCREFTLDHGKADEAVIARILERNSGIQQRKLLEDSENNSALWDPI